MATNFGLPAADFSLVENRLDLVNRFNAAYGFPPSLTVGKSQAQFISGEMSQEENEALIRLYSYLEASRSSR